MRKKFTFEEFYTLFEELRNDEKKFFNYFRLQTDPQHAQSVCPISDVFRSQFEHVYFMLSFDV